MKHKSLCFYRRTFVFTCRNHETGVFINACAAPLQTRTTCLTFGGAVVNEAYSYQGYGCNVDASKCLAASPEPAAIAMAITKLTVWEDKIDADHLCINLPPSTKFFWSVKALHTIRDKKLYKLSHQGYRSFEAYLLARWNVNRRLGDRLALAGGVVYDLEKTMAESELPSNATLCIAVYQWAKKQNVDAETVWKKALQHFDGRDNAVASQFDQLFATAMEAPLTPTPESGETRKDSAVEIPEDEDEEDEEEEEEEAGCRQRKPVERCVQKKKRQDCDETGQAARMMTRN